MAKSYGAFTLVESPSPRSSFFRSKFSANLFGILMGFAALVGVFEIGRTGGVPLAFLAWVTTLLGLFMLRMREVRLIPLGGTLGLLLYLIGFIDFIGHFISHGHS